MIFIVMNLKNGFSIVNSEKKQSRSDKSTFINKGLVCFSRSVKRKIDKKTCKSL